MKIDAGYVIDETYVDYAIEVARNYYASKRESCAPRLAGKDAAETASIDRYLESDPFNSKEARETVRAMLQALLQGVEVPDDKNVARDVVYLSGPKGSKQKLLAEVEKGELPELKALLDKIHKKHGYDGDFSRIKDAFKQHQTLFAEPQTYSKWRPLASGVDHALMKFCQDFGVSQIIDNAASPSNDALWKASVTKYREFANNNAVLHLFAVALAPKEAALEATKFGINAEEAEQDARNFCKFLLTIRTEFPNVTLYTSEMKMMLAQENSARTHNNHSDLMAWKKACEPQTRDLPK